MQKQKMTLQGSDGHITLSTDICTIYDNTSECNANRNEVHGRNKEIKPYSCHILILLMLPMLMWVCCTANVCVCKQTWTPTCSSCSAAWTSAHYLTTIIQLPVWYNVLVQKRSRKKKLSAAPHKQPLNFHSKFIYSFFSSPKLFACQCAQRFELHRTLSEADLIICRYPI